MKVTALICVYNNCLLLTCIIALGGCSTTQASLEASSQKSSIKVHSSIFSW